MFTVVFCCLVILFLYVRNLITNFLLLLAKFCDTFFENKFLATFGYITYLIAEITLIISSIVLAYDITPEVLEYIK